MTVVAAVERCSDYTILTANITRLFSRLCKARLMAKGITDAEERIIQSCMQITRYGKIFAREQGVELAYIHAKRLLAELSEQGLGYLTGPIPVMDTGLYRVLRYQYAQME